MKPYQQIPITECNEPLVAIPLDQFAVEFPHPYIKVAAPYGNRSPYYLRQGVLERLTQAQQSLQQLYPGWRIQIFDAYRQLAVQQYMVDYSFAQAVAAQGLSQKQLSKGDRQAILEQVYQFWAVPSYDPATPPPHSTGAAIDVTLVDALGTVVEMGSPIDEMSPRSYPDYFARGSTAQDNFHASSASLSERDRVTFHSHRQLLKQVMVEAGFCQHPREWWHFSFGDQLWAWLINQSDSRVQQTARYGLWID